MSVNIQGMECQGNVCMLACLFVCMFVCCMFVCLYVCKLYVCMYVIMCETFANPLELITYVLSNTT